MIDRLLSLVPWYWRWLALVGAFIACFGYGWVKGVEHEEGKLEDFRAGVEKVRAEAAARQAERKRLSEALIKEKDDERETQVADAHRFWTRYVDGLQRAAGSGPGEKPVRVDAKICNDETRDHELSGAVQAAQQDLRRAVAQYRAGLGPLLERAEVQTADLVNLQEAWAREKVLNAAP